MTDTELFQHIEKLVQDEHKLMQYAEGSGLNDDLHASLKQLEVSLDQCWDLLRQRRARPHAGLSPDGAQVREPEIVEHYQQ